jgi:hypothetical protein
MSPVHPFRKIELTDGAKKTDYGSSLLNPSMGRRRLASEARAARRGGGKLSRKPLKTGHRA